jgi:hypothetical protein
MILRTKEDTGGNGIIRNVDGNVTSFLKSYYQAQNKSVRKRGNRWRVINFSPYSGTWKVWVEVCNDCK